MGRGKLTDSSLFHHDTKSVAVFDDVGNVIT